MRAHFKHVLRCKTFYTFEFLLDDILGSHNIGGDPELLLRRPVQPAGNRICDSGGSGDVTLPSGER